MQRSHGISLHNEYRLRLCVKVTVMYSKLLIFLSSVSYYTLFCLFEVKEIICTQK